MLHSAVQSDPIVFTTDEAARTAATQEKAMKAEDLLKEIDETLAEARGETLEMTPEQFLAYVQAHTKRMNEEDDAEAAIQRATHLIEVLDLAKNFADTSSISVPMLTGPLSVQAQTAWQEFGERSVAMVSGLKAGFIDKAAELKGKFEAFVKANTEGNDVEDEDKSTDEGDGEGDVEKVDDGWPSNFNASKDEEDEITFGKDPVR